MNKAILALFLTLNIISTFATDDGSSGGFDSSTNSVNSDAGASGAGNYGAGAYGAGAYGAGAYGAGAYGAGAYGAGAYAAPYMNAGANWAGSYGPAAYGAGAYAAPYMGAAANWAGGYGVGAGAGAGAGVGAGLGAGLGAGVSAGIGAGVGAYGAGNYAAPYLGGTSNQLYTTKVQPNQQSKVSSSEQNSQAPSQDNQAQNQASQGFGGFSQYFGQYPGAEMAQGYMSQFLGGGQGGQVGQGVGGQPGQAAEVPFWQKFINNPYSTKHIGMANDYNKKYIEKYSNASYTDYLHSEEETTFEEESTLEEEKVLKEEEKQEVSSLQEEYVFIHEEFSLEVEVTIEKESNLKYWAWNDDEESDQEWATWDITDEEESDLSDGEEVLESTRTVQRRYKSVERSSTEYIKDNEGKVTKVYHQKYQKQTHERLEQHVHVVEEEFGWNGEVEYDCFEEELNFGNWDGLTLSVF